MKICVCVKQVPGTNEVRMDPVTNTIIREGVEAILNPFDTYAVEEALRLRERYGAELISLSMGIPAAAAIIKETIALGFDAGYLLSDRALAGADTLATAYTLVCGLRKIGLPQLILCGKMATDGDTAQVGPMMAEMLGYPHITDVSRIHRIEEGRAYCRKLTDDGYVDVDVELPAVLTVVKEINVPRLPSLQGMLCGRRYQVPVWDSAALGADAARIGLAGSPTQVVSTFVPDLSRNCELLAGNDAATARALLAVLRRQQLIVSDDKEAI